ncbi:IS3 family transposase [Porticoccus sp. W117]|uniref:IS3 family transposase n=1 Tax=Porticoccus sp. W117 TaxID=3054777 RepID=UPI00259159E2|nr:IS3 family transposase [Porticoccus sp. W117]MDM3872689.1 IS3 family transposase [Porticoccus sp. W117]
MKSTAKRTQRDYSLAFKLSVVDQVERGELTYKQAQTRYGIQGRSTVLVWLRKHGRLNWSQGTPYFCRRDIAMSEKPGPPTPEQRIKELEQQLAETQQKADFFEAVVDVLKKDYGVRVNKKASWQVIEEKQIQGLSVTKACQILGISRQAYYQQRQRSQQQETSHEAILAFVRHERLQHPRMGVRKLLHQLKTQTDLDIGRDQFFDLLRQHRLLVHRQRAYHKTTQSHHRFWCHPNLLKAGPEQVQAVRPEHIWVADITYLPVKQGEAYLSLITDAFSRKIVGYHVHGDLKAGSVLMAYKKALRERNQENELIHHSDRGIQYCSKLYQAEHERHGVHCSMTDGYDCYQNALAERVNGILKTEYLVMKPENIEQATVMVEESVELYNKRRPHMALKYKTPDEVHRAFLT